MTLLWLKDAVRNPHGRTLKFTETTDPKGCFHTTETAGWPGYQDWTVNPHATVMPIRGKGVTIRQHLPFDQASFSLRNLPGGVQTNTDYVFQFELIGTCDRHGDAFKAGAYYWPEADDAVLKDLLLKLVVPLSTSYKIPLKAQPFQAYPASAGAKKPAGPSNTVRMSGPAFDTYTGWLGHQHVPENVHGDPGAFPWARMIALLPKPTPPKPTPPVTEDIVSELKDYKVTLTTAAQVAAMNALRKPTDKQFKIGDTLPFDHLMLWGGPGMERLRHDVVAALAISKTRDEAILAAVGELSGKVDELLTKVDKLLPPTPPGGAQTV